MDADRMAELTQQIAFRLGMSPDELVELLWPAINERIEREWGETQAGPDVVVDSDAIEAKGN